VRRRPARFPLFSAFFFACGSLMLPLLPACESQRLVLVNIDTANDVDPQVRIAALEARTSLTNFKKGKHENTAGDAGTTHFPTLFGIYLHARSRSMTVRVFGYDPDGNLVAAGQANVPLDSEPTQRFLDPPLLLHACDSGRPASGELCHPPPPPLDGGVDTDAGDDGGEAEADGDAADARVEAGGDAADADTRPEVGEGSDHPDADGGPPDQPDDQTDVAPDDPPPDLPETEANADLGEAGADRGEAGTDVDDRRIPGPDAGPIPLGCVSYCTEVVNDCRSLFSGQGQCEAACAFAQLGPGDGTVGTRLNCRINEARLAFGDPDQASLVCSFASLLSPPCGPNPCFVYCTVGASVCGEQLFSPDDCVDSCLGLPVGDIGADRSGDSLACRMSWLQDAIDDQRLCERAGPVPVGPCQAQ
jgi:hypothetical protein